MTKSNKPKKKLKIRYIVLLVLLALVVYAIFEFKIIKIPRCDPPIQTEVDWPPAEHGIYEEGTHNRLRILEALAFPPTAVGLCNVSGAEAADVVATVPVEPRFLLYQTDLTDFSYRLFHSVDVAETFECVNVDPGNLVEGLVVEPDTEDPQMVWIQPPDPLEQGQVYMLTFGADSYQGVVVRVESPE